MVNALSRSATNKTYDFAVNWEPYEKQQLNKTVDTTVPLDKIQKIGRSMETLPEGFVVQPQVKKMLEARKKMNDGETPINWGYAEAMAFATLLDEGYPIRLCGQDAVAAPLRTVMRFYTIKIMMKFLFH